MKKVNKSLYEDKHPTTSTKGTCSNFVGERI